MQEAKEFTLVEKPFSWNENLSEIALEDFSMIQSSLTYCACQSIGMALAKLKLLEEQGCKVKGADMSDLNIANTSLGELGFAMKVEAGRVEGEFMQVSKELWLEIADRIMKAENQNTQEKVQQRWKDAVMRTFLSRGQ